MTLESAFQHESLIDVLVPQHFIEEAWLDYEWSLVFKFKSRSIRLDLDQACVTITKLPSNIPQLNCPSEYSGIPLRWVSKLEEPPGKLRSLVEYSDNRLRGTIECGAITQNSNFLLGFELEGSVSSLAVNTEFDAFELVNPNTLQARASPGMQENLSVLRRTL